MQPTADDHISVLRKERMLLKDKVYAYLTDK
ncbi:hypothetical protein [Octadecabacter antarcticus]